MKVKVTFTPRAGVDLPSKTVCYGNAKTAEIPDARSHMMEFIGDHLKEMLGDRRCHCRRVVVGDTGNATAVAYSGRAWTDNCAVIGDIKAGVMR